MTIVADYWRKSKWLKKHRPRGAKPVKRKPALGTASLQKLDTQALTGATKIIRNHTEDKENDFTILYVTG
jgi:hypothetical protein